MDNSFDLRRYFRGVFCILLLIVVLFWIFAIVGCSAKRKSVKESVKTETSYEIDKYKSDVKISEYDKVSKMLDSICASYKWNVVIYDTDKATFDTVNNIWNAPVKATINGESKIDAKTETEHKEHEDIAEESDTIEHSEASNEKENEKTTDAEKGDGRMNILIGLLSGILISVGVVALLKKVC